MDAWVGEDGCKGGANGARWPNRVVRPPIFAEADGNGKGGVSAPGFPAPGSGATGNR